MELLASSFWEALCLPGTELVLLACWGRIRGERRTVLARALDTSGRPFWMAQLQPKDELKRHRVSTQSHKE